MPIPYACFIGRNAYSPGSFHRPKRLSSTGLLRHYPTAGMHLPAFPLQAEAPQSMEDDPRQRGLSRRGLLGSVVGKARECRVALSELFLQKGGEPQAISSLTALLSRQAQSQGAWARLRGAGRPQVEQESVGQGRREQIQPGDWVSAPLPRSSTAVPH